VLDPDGNSAEAVHHDANRISGQIDHLWIRVANLNASRRFYETIAPYAGFRVHTDRPNLYTSPATKAPSRWCPARLDRLHGNAHTGGQRLARHVFAAR
jgi:catechol 2,3-dioxygenase-like lactoylglutathione lyase family enzyme